MPDEQAQSAGTAPEVQVKGQPSDSATATAQEADEPLGEAGLKALQKERERAARAERNWPSCAMPRPRLTKRRATRRKRI